MKKIILIFIGTLLLFSSCSKDYLDVNSDPSKVTSTDPKLLLTSAIVSSSYNRGGENSLYPSLFSNYVFGIDRQPATYSNYIVSAGDFDNIWKYGFYSNLLKNDYDLIQQSIAKNKPHYQATGNILMALGMIEATDLWGDIPYSEAFKGLELINPKFDDQQSVYNSADQLLDQAIALLSGPNNGSALDAGADLLYGGSVAKWKKLAYGLKARNYLHLTKKLGNSYYQKAIDAAMLSMTSAADNASLSFGTSNNNSNPWYQYNINRGDVVVHDDFVAMLDATTDPRKDFFVDADGYVGSFYASTTSPVDILTYEEVKFILAEAKQALGQSPTADFSAAVTANVARVTGAAADPAFVTSVTADESKSNIMQQKYIALFTSPEGWNDWRRTGLPALNPNTGTQIPRSLFYSAAEQQANANCPANSTVFRRVWWDN